MRISFLLLVSVGVSMLAAAACSGGDEATTSAGTASTASSGGTGGATTTSAGNGGQGGSGGATTTSAGTGGQGGSGGATTTSAGTGGQGGSGGTGGATTTSAGTGGQGGGGGGVGVVANCGSGDCSIDNGRVCCFNPNATPPDPVLECTAGGNCEVTVGCDGPEDCVGAEVCCHTGAVAECSASCSGNIFCHTAADCPDPMTYQCIQVFSGFVSACMATP